MKVWITKYALTAGIVEADVELTENGNAHAVIPFRIGSFRRFIRAIDVHQSQESAARRAGQMRDAKITSLQRQIRKLREMEFKP